MRILIDGYNLLHASTVTPQRGASGTLDATRNALLDFLIEQLPPGLAQLTTVVFDRGTERGLPARSTYGPLVIRFAINHPEADDLIEELVREHSSPKRLTVVSSDHRIQRAAKRRKARAVDSERWLSELSANSHVNSGRAEGPADAGADWLREFADVDLEQIKREVEAEDVSTSRSTADRASKKLPQSEPKTTPQRTGEKSIDSGDKKSPSENPFPPGYGDELLNDASIESPFPPGYGEDLLDDL